VVPAMAATAGRFGAAVLAALVALM